MENESPEIPGVERLKIYSCYSFPDGKSFSNLPTVTGLRLWPLKYRLGEKTK